MRKHYLLYFVVLLAALFIFSTSSKLPDVRSKPNLQKPKAPAALKPDVDFAKIPLYFIANKGQVNARAKFYAKTSRYTLWLTREGLVFDSMRIQNSEAPGGGGHLTASRHSPPPLFPPHVVGRSVSRLMFIGANKNPEILPLKQTELKVNYFKGSDPSKWHCDVPTSMAVLYKGLYKNIDLQVYGIERSATAAHDATKRYSSQKKLRNEIKFSKNSNIEEIIEYDWVVKPGADPADIKFKYKNVKGTYIDKEGNLVIETEFGRLLHKKPVSYQQGVVRETGGRDLIHQTHGTEATQNLSSQRDFVDVTFKKLGNNTYGFSVGKYDRTRDLVIDPVVLAYSTYLGGASHEVGYGIAVDGSGCVYVTGYTNSVNFPTLNQYQTDPGDSYYDVFVTKLDPTQSGASSLIYSTFLGGESAEGGLGIAVDGSGCAYVTGYTWSRDFPTLNQYQVDQGDGAPDVFVTKLDPTQSGASSLIYSTYLGGGSGEGGEGIAVDGSGCAYVTGSTSSTNFPTLNQYQTFQGERDVFVTKLDPTQSGAASLIYSTYLGGANTEYGYGIAVDGSGCAYVTGWTLSTDFPTLYQYQTYQVERDVFVTKLDPTQSGAASLIYSTYLGGGDHDYGYGIAVDAAGYAYVTGYTSSTTFPTLNQYQADQGIEDVFVTKLDPAQSGASSLLYSTYLGGGLSDLGQGIAVDGSGCAYVTGYTYSIDFPTLYQYQSNSGSTDAFVTKLDTTQSGASSLLYSTYLCGERLDQGYGIAVDGSGCAYVTGGTLSTDFPTLNQYQTLQGDEDVFVTKLYFINTTVTAPNGGESWMVGTIQNITWTTEGMVGNVRIEYSTNNGGNWTDIIASTANDGSHPWTIPDAVSSQCLVRISETDGSPTDTSDAVFYIIPVPEITVTSPNGGESWTAGSIQNITWASVGSVGNVRIEYSTNNGGNWTDIIASTANDGSYPWTIPGTVSTQCLVRVSETDGSLTDTSDTAFYIIPVPAITVTSPNGGENWQTGSVQNITWTSTGTVGNVRIEYSANSGSDWAEIIASTDNDGSHTLTVPEDVSGQCLIRVSETDGSPSDTSDAVFTISGIVVTSPNSGEILDEGKIVDITWDALGTAGQFKITLWQNGSKVGNITLINDLNARSYSWTVGEYIDGIANPGTGYTIKVKETDVWVSDESDAPFTIKKFMGVTSPDGGETWLAGATEDITWKAPASYTGRFGLALLKDGVNVGNIALITDPAARSYSWKVGEYSGGTAAAGTGYKIKIKALDSIDKTSDKSDAPFRIKNFSGVVSPNGGENLLIGTTWDITWNVPHSFNGKVGIILLKDGVKIGNIALITDPAARSYSWTVGEYSDGTAAAGTGYKIKIKVAGTTQADVSDSAFDLTN